MKIKLIDKEPVIIVSKARLPKANPCMWVSCRNLECADCPARGVKKEMNREEVVKWWEEHLGNTDESKKKK